MNYHQPVLLEETLNYLIQNKEGYYVDCTLGGGGHALGILSRLGPEGRLLALDRDQDAIRRSLEKFKNENRIEIKHSAFSQLGRILQNKKVDGILFDLGVSSYQLDTLERGFSFREEAPLDMRMDQTQFYTAEQWLEEIEEKKLAKIFEENSDLERSYAIARAIKKNMIDKSERRSLLIAESLKEVYPRGHKDWNGLLARIFQAIRMEVNQELEEIKLGLSQGIEQLNWSGRICVLSYHSVEDRQVKRIFNAAALACICPSEYPKCLCGGKNNKIKKVIKKPLTAKISELHSNPRARSAKLRVVERIEP